MIERSNVDEEAIASNGQYELLQEDEKLLRNLIKAKKLDLNPFDLLSESNHKEDQA